ncbi:MAG TPA: bifunctional nicotinamidase/pyrazinamidase [Roseimicrobium sp.]|nr:bifunctional nicotinamidase/pyrazinamidase [Roseimicrobium sp.]
MSRNALIIVDVQNDFVPGGSLAVPEGDRVVEVINRIESRFDFIVATQDWHPANHGSFAANHPAHKPGEIVDLNGLPQILWPVHCVQDTFGAEFVKGLDQRRVHKVFHKGTDPKVDSYSGLFDNGHKKDTGLAKYLQDQNVTDVFIVGLATDYCVKFTALDAKKMGFKTHVIAEGCRGVNLQPGDVDRAYEDMRKAGIIVE